MRRERGHHPKRSAVTQCVCVCVHGCAEMVEVASKARVWKHAAAYAAVMKPPAVGATAAAQSHARGALFACSQVVQWALKGTPAHRQWNTQHPPCAAPLPLPAARQGHEAVDGPEVAHAVLGVLLAMKEHVVAGPAFTIAVTRMTLACSVGALVREAVSWSRTGGPRFGEQATSAAVACLLASQTNASGAGARGGAGGGAGAGAGAGASAQAQTVLSVTGPSPQHKGWWSAPGQAASTQVQARHAAALMLAVPVLARDLLPAGTSTTTRATAPPLTRRLCTRTPGPSNHRQCACGLARRRSNATATAPSELAHGGLLTLRRRW